MSLLVGTRRAVLAAALQASALTKLRSAFGDAALAGTYWTSSARLATPGVVGVLDDGRTSTAIGRYSVPNVSTAGISLGNVTALNGATQFTLGVWVQPQTVGGTLFQRAHPVNWLTNQLLVSTSGGTFQVQISDGSGSGNVRQGSSPANSVLPGSIYKLFAVFDGSQATNAGRLALYIATYSPGVGFGADVAQAVTFVGTIPAALITNATLSTLIGNTDLNSAQAPGLYDEVRLWVGQALTPAQIAAETLSTNAIPASLRYTGADYTNHGTLAGFDGTPSGVTLCSDDVQWGSPFQFGGTAAPAFVQQNGVWVLRFDGVNDTSDHNAGLASVFNNAATGFLYAVVRRSVFVSAAGVLRFSGNVAANSRAVLFLDSSAGKFAGFLRNTEAGTSASIEAVISDATLRDDLYAIDLTAGKETLYQAGVQVAQNTSTLLPGTRTPATDSASVTAGAQNGANFLNGDISALVVGRVAPTAAQVAALHAFGVAAGAAA